MKPRTAVIAGAIAAVAAGMLSTPPETPETPVPQEVQVQEVQVPEYAAVWDWCGVRFPFRKDLQEACRWGAHEMLPKQEAWADERTHDA